MGLGHNKMRSLKSALKYGEALEKVMLREMARECGFEDDHFEKLIDKRGNINFYMDPEEAKSRGFIDHVARPKLDVRADGSFEVVTS
jgi:ATP-dependent protease ClpP protease subunit